MGLLYYNYIFIEYKIIFMESERDDTGATELIPVNFACELKIHL